MSAEDCMSSSPSNSPSPRPPWLIGVGSIVIAGHLLALGASVLAAPSGPWPTPYGSDTAQPPGFVRDLYMAVRPTYLQPLKLTHNYHFDTNRGELPGVYFKVQLRGATGETLGTLTFPEKDANPWVRHRQGLLARALAADQPVQPPAGEAIPAPHQDVRSVQIWDLAPDQSLHLSSVPEHRVPRNRPVSRPSELSLLLARSYARYLCRQYGAASAQITRHSREAISPVVLFEREVPPGFANELVAHFGELPK
jgi:hypothetical protein